MRLPGSIKVLLYIHKSRKFLSLRIFTTLNSCDVTPVIRAMSHQSFARCHTSHSCDVTPVIRAMSHQSFARCHTSHSPSRYTPMFSRYFVGSVSYRVFRYGMICITYRGADKSLARPTSRCILFDGENISFDASLVIQVSQEERTKLREGVPYVKLYRHNPKHLCPKLNGY